VEPTRTANALQCPRIFPFLCLCGQSFTDTKSYSLHFSQFSSFPPAIINGFINSKPLVEDERLISRCLTYCKQAKMTQSTENTYSIYCLVGVPVDVYRSTTLFSIRSYMTDCLERNEPIFVYIGKCSASISRVSEYHTDPLLGFTSTIGKSIMLEKREWFHVRSEVFETLQQAEKAEVLAQVFVEWRCHIQSHKKKYLPAWTRSEKKQFLIGTSVDEKFGLLKIFKDVNNVELFCFGCLKGTCNKPHDKSTQIFLDEPLPAEVLFSGNWNIWEPNDTPLRIK
jgi:hypothetical protein